MQLAFQSHLIAIKEVFSDQRKLQNLYDGAAQKTIMPAEHWLVSQRMTLPFTNEIFSKFDPSMKSEAHMNSLVHAKN